MTSLKDPRVTGMEALLWSCVLIPPLIPSLQAGVSVVEVGALVVPLLAGTLLTLGRFEKLKPGLAPIFLGIYLALSTLSLSHEELRYFLNYFAAALLFTVCTYVGNSAPERIRQQLVVWLFFQLLAGACLDLTLDYYGWSPRSEAPQLGGTEWELGIRGQVTSTSLNGVYLAPVALWTALNNRAPWLRLVAVGALFLTFYHVVVFGQGRGSTALVLIGAALVAANSRKAARASLIVLIPVATLSALGTLDELLAPLSARVESEELQEADRIEHFRVGLRLISTMDTEELLTGIWHYKVWAANSGASIHNALLDTFTRYGLLATVPYGIFFLILAWHLGERMLKTSRDHAETVSRAIVAQLLIASTAAGLFANWRMCVVPALSAGLLLSRFKPRKAS